MKTIPSTASKVPAVTLGFWIAKILATTLGETAGDTVSMTWNLGYLVGSAIFLTLFALLAWLQIAARRFNPPLYWATIVASTTAGTTMADYATRSMGIGYPGGSILLFGLVLVSIAAWFWSQGSVSVDTIKSRKVEAYYWLTITFSQTLGTALGDWVADAGAGYGGGALVFGAMLAVVAAAHFWTRLSKSLIFWSAFILTRPLGATVGDFLDKPVAKGGLDFSRPIASVVILVLMIIVLLLFRDRGNNSIAPSQS
jgi:uncharacterized membrane-anchored protein